MLQRRSLVPGLLALGLAVRLAPAAQAATIAAGPPAAQPAPDAAPAPPPPLTAADIAVETLRLQEALAHEVPHLIRPTPAADAQWIELARAELAAATWFPDRPQLLVVVDRNPRVQQLALVLANPGADWKVLGGTKVSTGSMGRFDHYITPRGVFHVTTAILGFRAEGTLNENGIRGYGVKGMRVWDFGWQVAAKGWNAGPGKPDHTPIRLEMHATDPDHLEQRIGQPASQGCVRIPAAMNHFLDNHGILDTDYERAAATEIRFRALLPPNRTPSLLAGNTLVVVDSAEKDKTPIKVAAHTS